MKKSFIVWVDYGNSGIVVRIFARTMEEIKEYFPTPKWVIIEECDPNCPKYNHKILESDIDNREPWLKELIYGLQKEVEGKLPFPVRGRRWGIFYEERNLWARSKEEIEETFPTLEFRYLVPWKCKKYSDIDVEDEFTSKYKVKNT